jgi:hypothetical protein
MKLSHLLSEESDYGIRVGSVIAVDKTGGAQMKVLDTIGAKARFYSDTSLMAHTQTEDCILALVGIVKLLDTITYTTADPFIVAFRMQEGIGGRLTPDFTRFWTGSNRYYKADLSSLNTDKPLSFYTEWTAEIL